MLNRKTNTDKAYDVWRFEHQPLDAIFRPKAVALIGATERQGSVGRTILWNLLTNSFGGTIFPVNPKRRNVLGIKSYPSVQDIPEPVDLAIIVTPAPTVPGIIRDCVAVGVRGAIVISAGFKEIGPEGAALEQAILAEANKGDMRVVGPNCLGVMSPVTGLNATFASAMARPGSVGFISQSGALCTAILDWSLRENVGFSAFVSMGSMLDVGWGDLIYYLGDDPNTKSIVIYMETIGDARSFMSAAREVALTKPIIIIKPGRTAEAAQAAASHTGSLTGSDEVLAAAFRRCGALRVEHISELFDMASVLAKQPRPQGNRLSIITNAGGPGVLATDALITGGGELSAIAPETMDALNTLLPPHWSHNNPIDVLGDADPGRYAETLEIMAKDPNSDGLLVILTPQAMTDPTETAAELSKYARLGSKPLLASWMGGDDVRDGEELLNNANIPTFDYPDTAVQVFNYMWRYNRNLRSLYDTPQLPTETEVEDWHQARARVEQIIAEARQSGRTILTEYESKRLLAAYDIPIVATYLAQTAAEAVSEAEEIGYPVVLKLNSKTITHKTDIGGVRLNLRSADAVRAAFEAIETAVQEKAGAHHFQGVTVQPMLDLSDGYEIIIGSSPDLQFGPVLLFGTGGSLVEVYRDRALGLPPLTTTLARHMMRRTKIYHALQGVRGRAAVDLDALDRLMVRFSFLVVEHPWIKEIDINPLLASAERLIALDARVVLHDTDTVETDLPRPAIRPYPTQYTSTWTTYGGIEVLIRPIYPTDEPRLVKFHEELSEQTVYQRYFQALNVDQRVTHERLTRTAFVDFDREMVLIVTYFNPESEARELAAVGRLSKSHTHSEAEFALLIHDKFQRQGLGTELLSRLLRVAHDERIHLVTAYMLPDNKGMRRICEKLGFQFVWEEGVLKASIEVDSL